MTTFLDNMAKTLEHDTILDVAKYGCEGGAPGLTYTADLVLLYDTFQVEIFDALTADAEDLGFSNPLAFVASFRRADGIVDSDTFKERLVWWMAEREAQRYADAVAHDEEVA